jgi:hypothetical protein
MDILQEIEKRQKLIEANKGQDIKLSFDIKVMEAEIRKLEKLNEKLKEIVQ